MVAVLDPIDRDLLQVADAGDVLWVDVLERSVPDLKTAAALAEHRSEVAVAAVERPALEQGVQLVVPAVIARLPEQVAIDERLWRERYASQPSSAPKSSAA